MTILRDNSFKAITKPTILRITPFCRTKTHILRLEKSEKRIFHGKKIDFFQIRKMVFVFSYRSFPRQIDRRNRISCHTLTLHRCIFYRVYTWNPFLFHILLRHNSLWQSEWLNCRWFFETLSFPMVFQSRNEKNMQKCSANTRYEEETRGQFSTMQIP